MLSLKHDDIIVLFQFILDWTNNDHIFEESAKLVGCSYFGPTFKISLSNEVTPAKMAIWFYISVL